MRTSLPQKEKALAVPGDEAAAVPDGVYLELCSRNYPAANRTALLSLIPGLGQIKNGELGKGLLFLAITLANVAAVIAISMSGQLGAYLSQIAIALHRQPNFDLAAPFNASVLQSPALLMYAVLAVTFIAYAVRDAHDGAVQRIRGERHPKYILQLPEAASGSYLFHLITMAALILAVIFFISPQPPKQQVTLIELMQEPPKPKTPDKPAPKKENKKPALQKPEPIKRVVVPPKVEPKVEKVVPPKPMPVAVAVPTKDPTPLSMAPVSAPAPSAAPVSSAPTGSSGGTGGTGSGSSGTGSGEVDMGPWMKDLQRKIKHNWYPPKGNESKRIKVSFKVFKDGHITRVRLASSSGVQVADDAALQALTDAAPFATLPDGVGDDVDINFTFDYNVFGAGRGR